MFVATIGMDKHKLCSFPHYNLEVSPYSFPLNIFPKLILYIARAPNEDAFYHIETDVLKEGLRNGGLREHCQRLNRPPYLQCGLKEMLKGLPMA